MKPENILIVKKTWSAILPMSAEATTLFYSRLFEMNPGIRHLFHTEMGEQRRMLISAMDSSIRLLDRQTEFNQILTELGRRHSKYGVQPAHFEPVGASLIWALQCCLGEEFTLAAQEAWLEFYQEASFAMQAGMKE